MPTDDERLPTGLEVIIERCSTSRNRRRTTYRYLRQWFQRGVESGGLPALFNRLHAHVEKLSSMIYAPESSRFALAVSPAVRQGLLPQLDIARDEWAQVWRATGSDVAFATAVDWATVYGTIVCKVIPGEGGAVHYADIDPAAFGVGREDIPSLDRQPYFTHWYVISLPELQDKIRGLPVEEQARIMAHAEAHALPNHSAGVDAGSPGGMMGDVVVTSMADPSHVQGYLDLSAMNSDRPDVTEPLVELAEVWVRSQYTKAEPAQDPVRFWDWKVSTVLGPFTLWETRNPVLPYVPANPTRQEGPIQAELPFVAVRVNPVRDYFWGRSEVAPLTRLQAVADDHLADIRDMMGRQLDPSGLMTGVPFAPDKIEAIRKKGNWLAVAAPGGKLQPLVPTMPPQAFELLQKFDEMFNEEGGIPEDLGTGQEDIRVQGQIAGTARKMGRIRKKALVVEDALEVLATRMFHVKQRNDETAYPLEDGTVFYLADLPADCVVQVSAHSASPVYAEQELEKAALLYKAGAIDDLDFIEMVNPAQADRLREKAKGIMEGKAKAAGEKMDIERLKATRPARR